MRSVAAAFIADTYALGTGPWTVSPVARGALGQIWKLSGHGSSWAVKELLFGCDEEQVEREAALRDATERLGISSPTLVPSRAGAHVCRLPPSLGGSFVKLYDWIEGTEADPRDPDVLSWCGRTLALLHRAGEGAAGRPSAWYEECPGEADWEELLEAARRAGTPWSEDLGRFVATSAAELARHVTPSGPDPVTSHLDMRPQNVLVGPAGPVLLDWDNAGPVSAERELARAVYVWAGGNHFDADRARRLVRAYRDAGGPGAVKGPDSFSMLFATDLNYVRVQAECALDPTVTQAQRRFASDQVVAALRGLPDLSAVTRLTRALECDGPAAKPAGEP
ncbi:phosphotransferase enzyme family protein [Streptomyces resistomycificus]|uniref:Phosphotransferase n=1 Tax=Streptomyces resistomycificus TaxID=67356 RepID=A0A0L8LD73_9ACTN|nr:aminoglycoside phosphotransferase family protein [Streptomyces resistomycificus]KOG36105.1 phosphotransferase [Streptomyces resistomycificus]KUN92315.1 phosphotransferase [Streptomyces resistomycificus]